MDIRKLILEQLLSENIVESPIEFIREEIRYSLYNKRYLSEGDDSVITRAEAEIMIRGSGGTVFTTTFTKKDGTNRVMKAKLGVKVGITGKGMKYNPDKMNYLIVWDVSKGGYRILSLNTVNSLKINGKQYIVR